GPEEISGEDDGNVNEDSRNVVCGDIDVCPLQHLGSSNDQEAERCRKHQIAAVDPSVGFAGFSKESDQGNQERVLNDCVEDEWRDNGGKGPSKRSPKGNPEIKLRQVLGIRSPCCKRSVTKQRTDQQNQDVCAHEVPHVPGVDHT